MQRLFGMVFAVLALSACTDYDDVTRGVCGNGLLEAGEDCDSSDATCVRCAVACRVALDCPTTGDYACGVDGFCHAPGGALAQPTAPVTFQATDLRITDVDHDGRGDVVGVSRTSIAVRYGDPTGSLAAGDSFVTPPQSGPASFGDLDGDGTLDVTLSTLDGLVTYTSEFGTLAPVDVEAPILDGTTGEAIDMFAIESFGPLQILAFGALDGNVVLFVLDFLAPADLAFAAPCVARLGAIPRASFEFSRVDIYRASPDGALTKNVVVSFTTTAGAACVMSISGSGAAGYTLVDVTPAGIGALQTKPILADLETDADPCPGLVNSDGGSALRWWDGRMSGGRCILDAAGPRGAALPALPGAPPGAVAIGRLPVRPAIPFVAADAIVMSTGIYGHVPGLGMSLFYQSSRRLSHVAFGDLDGDGDIDAIVTAATEDDLDILYRYPEGLALLRYDTASQVTRVTIADFDGNGIGDFAYAESAASHERLMIAYGTADRHLPPLQVAAFAAVSSLTPIELPDATDRLSIADDLLVIQAAGGAAPTLTFLHGSPQRTMLAFLDPRDAAGQAGSTMRGTVVGQFTGDGHPDLLMFAAPTADAPELGMRAYRIAGSAIGLDPREGPGTLVDGLDDCQQAAGAGACVQDIAYLAWPRAVGTDVVIAIDRRAAPRAMRIDPGQPAAPVDAIVADLPPGAVVTSLHAVDLDGDGANELVASFASRSGALTGSVRICDVSADGTPTRCEDVGPAVAAVTATANPTCIDAAPGRIGVFGLVVLCRDGSAAELFRVTRAHGVLAAVSLAQGSGLRALRVGDVTGDGVDDVVAVQGDVGAALVVFTQCTTRDLGACHASSSAEGVSP